MSENKRNNGQPKPVATKSPYVVIRKSKIHGSGGFAKKDIPAGARVIEYVGERITKKESDRRYQRSWERSENGHKGAGIVYIFTLNKRHDIDGDVWWNTARNINHSCDPNCETDIIRGRIWIIATRDIKKGEEISYNYGYDYESWDDHPCRCGSEKCVGFIVDEDHWSKLRRNRRYKELMRGKGKGSPDK